MKLTCNLKLLFLLIFTFLFFANSKAQGLDTALEKKHKGWVKPLLATGYATSTYLSYKLLDTRWQDELQEGKNKFKTQVARMANPFGVGKYNTIAVGTVGIVSILTKNKKLQATAIIWLGSQAINSVITDQLKITFQRHRPNTGDLYNTFDWRGGPHVNASFPSAHTSNAFTMATVFATLYNDKKWVPVVAYSIATLTGLSRIYNNAHWTSDVLAGAAVGFLSAKAMISLYNKLNQRFSLLPSWNNNCAHIHLSYNF